MTWLIAPSGVLAQRYVMVANVWQDRARRMASAGAFGLAGVVCGLGFVAAAAKFQANGVSLTQLLNVGLVQFAALHRIEWVVFPALAALAFWAAPRARTATLMTAGLFLVQAFAVLPGLHERMVVQARGGLLPPSNHHIAYVVVALAYVCGLLWMGAALQRAPEAAAAPDAALDLERDYRPEVNPKTPIGVS